MTDLAGLTAEHFEPLLDQGFRVAVGEGIPLRLAELRRHGPGGRAGGAFALTFLAPPGPFLPQAIYPVEHEGLGRLEIFLVPLGPEAGANAYEAVFG